tara:strand:+ start:266 stop:517 length:252 start_codon:yes stop_codon:yes gene_type:complete
MSPYVPATSVYGVNSSNRRQNRHFFGMGNNLIVAPYGVQAKHYNYPPSGGDSMNNTVNGFSGSQSGKKGGYNKYAEPSSGPQK